MKTILEQIAEKRHILLCVENILDHEYMTPEKSESMNEQKKQLKKEIEELKKQQ